MWWMLLLAFLACGSPTGAPTTNTLRSTPPARVLTPEQCGRLGGTCEASGECVKLGTDGGEKKLGTCATGDGGGPIEGGGKGGLGEPPDNHCVDGRNDVDYNGLGFDCGAEGDRCRAVCDKGAGRGPVRDDCVKACINTNLNCCTGEDPTRRACGKGNDIGVLARCQKARVECDANCATDPGKNGALPRSTQQCLAQCRLDESNCCVGITQPAGER
jgi:hypothetical protein